MVTAKKTPAKAKAAKAAKAANALVADTQFAMLMDLKLNLQAVREKLMLVQPDTLNDDDHKAWTDQIFKVSMAINAVRTALLGQLSDNFAAELPGLEQATGHLTDDLFKLQQSVDVINTVASALGVIEQIAALVA